MLGIPCLLRRPKYHQFWTTQKGADQSGLDRIAMRLSNPMSSAQSYSRSAANYMNTMGGYTPGNMGAPIGARIVVGKMIVDGLNYPLTDPVNVPVMAHHWGGGVVLQSNGKPLTYRDALTVGDALSLAAAAPELAAALRGMSLAGRAASAGAKVVAADGAALEFAAGRQVFTADLSHVTGKAAVSRNRAISAIIDEDLSSLRLTHTPEYSPFIGHGVAMEGTGTQIGKKVFASRAELHNTIVHEELHHRWWSRGIYDHHPAGSAMETKFYNTIDRYERMRGWKP